jgi:NAD-dependent dihydropyrimidine dehydrogenase PreA subunit
MVSFSCIVNVGQWNKGRLMSKRKIINIDQDKCDGCGLCMPNCPEGALQIIDGKARLVSDLFCDGLGACIGHCPKGAITVEERESEPYDEKKVMENIVKQGPSVIRAHLGHLKEHGEGEFLKQAMEVLKEKEIKIESLDEDEGGVEAKESSGCPGTKVMDFSGSKEQIIEQGERNSQLRQWPVQLHLVPTTASYFQGKDVVLAADCVAYAMADFHKDYLKGKSLAIACPKLDSEQEIYVEKITALINEAKINTLTVMIMEVPCCAGLLTMAKRVREQSERKVPIKQVTVGIKGEVLAEEWV